MMLTQSLREQGPELVIALVKALHIMNFKNFSKFYLCYSVNYTNFKIIYWPKSENRQPYCMLEADGIRM